MGNWGYNPFEVELFHPTYSSVGAHLAHTQTNRFQPPKHRRLVVVMSDVQGIGDRVSHENHQRDHLLQVFEPRKQKTAGYIPWNTVCLIKILIMVY